MTRKLLPVISIIVITAMGILFFVTSNSSDKEILKSSFDVDATYYDSGIIEISFLDKTRKTNKVVLEVLGMEKSFQKTFSGSEFVESIKFESIPKYGWQIHPVVFLIDHQEFGKISIKTEIHNYGQPPPQIIYSYP